MRNRFAVIASLAGLALMASATSALGDSFADIPVGGRSVALTDARVLPDLTVKVPAGKARTYAQEGQCGTGYWTEFSAYRANGGSLSAQAWTDKTQTVIVWRTRSGRSVTFDGITVRNHTAHTVLFAGWCS